ncbi:MAG: DUF5378 family protein [Mycoplasma sp.]|nr:DUF5378 family protein [Candidatus Hennigella equi]
MSIAGLALVLITVALAAGMIVCNKWIRKVTNCYFFWLAIAVFCLTWLIMFRFRYDWAAYGEWIKEGGFTDPSSEIQSRAISKAFLLDVCPFAAFTINALLIVDPTRKAARAFAPAALIGGAFTIIGVMFAEPPAELTWEFIFIGIAPNRCYFIMHFMQVMVALGVMLNTPRNGWKGFLASLLATIFIYSYVGIVMTITGCRWYCSGLAINDWESGEYSFAAQIFGLPPKLAPYIAIPLLFALGAGFIALKDYVFGSGHWDYGNAFSKKWYAWYDYKKHVVQKIL